MPFKTQAEALSLLLFICGKRHHFPFRNRSLERDVLLSQLPKQYTTLLWYTAAWHARGRHIGAQGTAFQSWIYHTALKLYSPLLPPKNKTESSKVIQAAFPLKKSRGLTNFSTLFWVRMSYRTIVFLRKSKWYMLGVNRRYRSNFHCLKVSSLGFSLYISSSSVCKKCTFLTNLVWVSFQIGSNTNRKERDI